MQAFSQSRYMRPAHFQVLRAIGRAHHAQRLTLTCSADLRYDCSPLRPRIPVFFEWLSLWDRIFDKDEIFLNNVSDGLNLARPSKEQPLCCCMNSKLEFLELFENEQFH